MSEPLPHLESDAAAERFVETADLTKFDLDEMTPHTFEFARNSIEVRMLLPEQLVGTLKTRAAEQGISYERLIRRALEDAAHAIGQA